MLRRKARILQASAGTQAADVADGVGDNKTSGDTGGERVRARTRPAAWNVSATKGRTDKASSAELPAMTRSSA
jgi:hypothetical protein